MVHKNELEKMMEWKLVVLMVTSMVHWLELQLVQTLVDEKVQSALLLVQ